MALSYLFPKKKPCKNKAQNIKYIVNFASLNPHDDSSDDGHGDGSGGIQSQNPERNQNQTG